jgi:hypothetical protein
MTYYCRDTTTFAYVIKPNKWHDADPDDVVASQSIDDGVCQIWARTCRITIELPPCVVHCLSTAVPHETG